MDVSRSDRSGLRCVDTPRLLVSVRNVAEAAEAVAGGCQILDVKEPTRGPLGMASGEELARILGWLRECRSDVPASCALGEASDWTVSGSTRGLVADSQSALFSDVPRGFAYCKLGLSNWDDSNAAMAAWSQLHSEWKQSHSEMRMIAVIYADWPLCGAPEPGRILSAAIEQRAAGVLVDTAIKGAGRLFDHISTDSLALLAQQTHSAGLSFGVAGRLRREDLPQLRPVQPDVIGIRSAGCPGGERLGGVNRELVGQFGRAIREVFSGGGALPRVLPPVQAELAGRGIRAVSGIDPAQTGNAG